MVSWINIVLITVFDAGNFIICGSSTQSSYVWDYSQLEKKRNVSKSTSEGDFSFPIASGTYFLETLSRSSTPTPTFQGACSSTHSIVSFAFWSSTRLSCSLTPLPLTFPPHTFFSDVIVGCLKLNLPRDQSQRKFKSSNYAHVPFFEVSLCVFFLKSPQTGGLPPDCSKCCHGDYSFRGYQGPPGPPGPPGIPGKDERDALFPVYLQAIPNQEPGVNLSALGSLVYDPELARGKSKRELGRQLHLLNSWGRSL